MARASSTSSLAVSPVGRHSVGPRSRHAKPHVSHHTPRIIAACAALVLSLPAPAVVITTEFGINFATVGAPGNRDTLPFEVPASPDIRVGGVSYEYRLSQTEITTRQWLPFVRAYAPYVQGNPAGSAFTSLNIVLSGGQYHMLPGTEDWPVTMSWRIAARYANWLHHGQSADPAAFESGAYDTSTFGTNAQGLVTDQRHHSPGAKFWIPTLDEWYKGVYYDPVRYGPGQGGYWLHPGSTMEELVSGMPGTPGAQTNGGFGVPGHLWGMDVGQYPDTTTPWGLLDASGGVQELSEDFVGEELGWDPANRWVMGSRFQSAFYTLFDRLDHESILMSPELSGGGLRLVAFVPSPGSFAALSILAPFAFRRTHR